MSLVFTHATAFKFLFDFHNFALEVGLHFNRIVVYLYASSICLSALFVIIVMLVQVTLEKRF